MIYHLFEYLRQYDIPGQGLFTYLSFRAMLTSITAMLLSFFAGRKIIKWLQRKQIGESSSSLRLWFLSCCSATLGTSTSSSCS